MKIKSIVRPLKIKAIHDDGTFEGYGSVFDVIDSYRDIVLPGAFEQTIEEHEAKGEMPALLWQHRSDTPIGVWTSMKEDEHGLKMEGQLLLDVAMGKEAHVLLKAGAVKGLSIGFSLYPGGERYNEDAQIWELSNINLWETSIVTFPANQEAQVTDVRAKLEKGIYPTERELQAFLTRDAGFSRTDAQIIINEGFKGMVTRDADYSDAMTRVDDIINSIK